MPATITTRLTLTSTLTIGGRSIEQFQFATAEHVVTRVGGMTLVFEASTGDRSVVDLRDQCLRPLPTEALRERAALLRQEIGRVTIIGPETEPSAESEPGMRYRYFNDGRTLVVRGSVRIDNDERLAGTALIAERAARTEESPFVFPLQPHQILLEARTRTVSADFEESSTYRLGQVTPEIEDEGWLERILSFPKVSGSQA